MTAHQNPATLMDVHDELRLLSRAIDLVFRADGVGLEERDDVLLMAERGLQRCQTMIEDLQAAQTPTRR